MENKNFKFNQAKSILDLLVDKIKVCPEQIAVTFNNSSITYYDLDHYSDALARVIIENSKSVHPKIGLVIDRSIELIIAMIAVLKVNGVCVPLDSSYPQNRLEFMAHDADIELLLTTNKIISCYPFIQKVCDNILVLNKEIYHKNIPFTKKKSNLEDLIYILYTSGSTGQPKGVAMPHRVLLNLVNWHLHYIDDEVPTKTLQFASISFDVAFQEIFSTLCSGQTLVLVSEEARKNPQTLLDLIRENNITRLFLPTIALQQLAEAANKTKPLPTLRTVIVAGEQLKITQEIELFFKSLNNASLYNHYGPTETHVVTSNKLCSAKLKESKLPHIGFPIFNVETYILDEKGEMVSVGNVGELYLGGACLAHGYHKRPSLTRERFIANPFGQGVLYRTGDLVCRQSDGAIQYIGRIDQQIKIRGFRVELGEVEVTLLTHPKILQCVVMDQKNELRNTVLVAYLVVPLDYQKELNVLKRKDFDYKVVPRSFHSELQHYLNKTLPDYMIPSFFILIDEVPLTPSGKVERRSLPVPPIVNINSLILSLKDLDVSLEKKITYCWEELLQVKPIAAHENFFDLGGHSLLLITLHKVLSEILNYQFPIISLFNYPTIASLTTFFSTKLNVLEIR